MYDGKNPQLTSRKILMLCGLITGSSLPFASIIMSNQIIDINTMVPKVAGLVFAVGIILIALKFFLMRKDIATFTYAITVLFTVSFFLIGIGIALLTISRFTITDQPIINLIYGTSFLMVGIGGWIASIVAHDPSKNRGK